MIRLLVVIQSCCCRHDFLTEHILLKKKCSYLYGILFSNLIFRSRNCGLLLQLPVARIIIVRLQCSRNAVHLTTSQDTKNKYKKTRQIKKYSRFVKNQHEKLISTCYKFVNFAIGLEVHISFLFKLVLRTCNIIYHVHIP